MAVNPDIEVLNSIYQNAETGRQAINDLMPMVGDRGFAADLETQCGLYESIGQEAASRLLSLGEKPQDVNPVKRAGMKMGVVMNTITNDETEHLAELMIKGSNMGIIDMTKTINTITDASPEALGLAQKLVTSEHDNITRLKTYLKQ